jgi:hypothetical protein
MASAREPLGGDCVRKEGRYAAMTAEINNPEIPMEEKDPNALDAQEQQNLDRIADKAAKRAEEREKRYDEEHDIFTK